jgi:hypothetical protein
MVVLQRVLMNWDMGVRLTAGAAMKAKRQHRKFPVRTWLAGNIFAPVGSAEIGSANDDKRAEFLIGEERKECAVNDGAGFRSALALGTVAGRAEGGVNGCAARGVAGLDGGIRRRSDAGESVGFCVAFAKAADDDVNLSIGEHAASGLGEGGHGGASDAVGHNFAESVVVHDSEINGITEGECGPAFGFRAVTAGTISGVKQGEVGDVFGVDRDGGCGGAAGEVGAGGEEEDEEKDQDRTIKIALRGQSPRVCRVSWHD